MNDLELRREALHLAASFASCMTRSEVIETAQMFAAFLAGGVQQPRATQEDEIVPADLADRLRAIAAEIEARKALR